MSLLPAKCGQKRFKKKQPAKQNLMVDGNLAMHMPKVAKISKNEEVMKFLLFNS